MKTFEEVLDFFDKFTLCDPFSFGRIIELNHVRDCIKSVFI